MLDIAGKYENELKLLFTNITFDEKYKYLDASSYRDIYTSTTSTWSKHEFVSIYNNKIIGYMKYSIDRDSNIAHAMRVVNFDNKCNIIFSKDLRKFLTDIFEKFQFRKLVFSVIIGNPVEKSYDKICEKHGGRIIGIKKENCKLIDGNYYDIKIYEILRSDYIKNKEIKHENIKTKN